MSTPDQLLSWREVLSIYAKPRVIAMVFLGFSGGLPFLLVFSTLTAWLRDEGVSRSAIGFFAWVGITYSVKVIWAPVVDRISIPFVTRRLGQRRSWILIGQTGIAAGLFGMAMVDHTELYLLSLFALLVAFSSATQDIAIDAYRIEAMQERFQGAMSAAYIFGYRVALLVAGAGSLYIAEYANWTFAYQVMGALVFVGIVTVLLIDEPESHRREIIASAESDSVHFGFINAVVRPFTDFFSRNGKFALVILLFIAVFRLSDIAMGIMANPFYLDMGYSKTDIANVAKVFGFFMTIAGSFICGILVVKWGIFRCLLIGATAVALTNVLFSMLSLLQPDIIWLAGVISADNISGGFAATAFVAYLSSLTNRAYTATQYALFSSLMTLPGKFISGFSGIVVDAQGYFVFFLVAAALGIPAILLVLVLMKREMRVSQSATDTA
ncbi:MAG TPA: AmpG family muropeptide MFS transporter [Pseudomonadales bacterium]|nr:AmpG family muropeptide MFS transporter [Pseudomonadales bacterium]MDP6316316.1 AmpG family muropeptide MFS transporter [Pseudomonadales bacterium]MDP7314906.1 AmpG family muropeptide MFS transporter [Pseudomonadales bacterium]HJP50340.1 AmpG family muropeptide MFS transporter [Pseudomonadales bacterium]|tara:strand:- start:22027 stop:23343 length:1317 start_codon:yes stop_codon:yes gene_type:complete